MTDQHLNALLLRARKARTVAEVSECLVDITLALKQLAAESRSVDARCKIPVEIVQDRFK